MSDVPRVESVARDTSDKFASFIEGELTGCRRAFVDFKQGSSALLSAASCEEYALLEKLNTIAAAEYKEMGVVAESLNTGMQALNTKCTFCIYFAFHASIVDGSVS